MNVFHSLSSSLNLEDFRNVIKKDNDKSQKENLSQTANIDEQLRNPGDNKVSRYQDDAELYRSTEKLLDELDEKMKVPFISSSCPFAYERNALSHLSLTQHCLWVGHQRAFQFARYCGCQSSSSQLSAVRLLQ